MGSRPQIRVPSTVGGTFGLSSSKSPLVWSNNRPRAPLYVQQKANRELTELCYYSRYPRFKETQIDKKSEILSQPYLVQRRPSHRVSHWPSARPARPSCGGLRWSARVGWPPDRPPRSRRSQRNLQLKKWLMSLLLVTPWHIFLLSGRSSSLLGLKQLNLLLTKISNGSPKQGTWIMDSN